MNLLFSSIETLVADEKINDDAFEMWLQSTHLNKGSIAPAAFYSRHHIQKGNEYLRISFVDTETGEVIFYNCLPKMHKAMLSYEIYPEIVLNAFKN